MAPLPRLLRPVCALLAFALSSIATFAQNVAVTTLHAPTINGGARVEGSVQQLRGENVTLNGNATLTEDLLVPGTPNIQINGNASWQGSQAGSGATTPAGYTVGLGGDVTLRYVRTRTDPVAIPTVPAPPATRGSRNVELKRATDGAGDWATVRDLKLSGQAGTFAVPPGTYRDFTASGQTGLILGIAGATQPAAYNLQSLTLNGQARLDVIGPIVLTLNSGLGLHGQIGNAQHPEWLQIRIASGGVEINGGATLHAGLVAPSGTLQINGQGIFCGTAAVDRFTIHGGGLVRWRDTNLGGGNRAPVADPQNVTTAEETPLPIALTGSDPDGNSLAFTITTPPQHGTLSGAAPNLIYTPAANFPATNTGPGTDTFTFTVHDGAAASAPAIVTITITPVNDPPVAHAQQVVVTEDTPLVLTLTGGDADGDALTFSIPAGQQMLGTVERYTGPGAAPGDFLYTPAPNNNAPDSFIFLIEDGHGGSAQGSVAIAITPVDDIPVVAPLQLTVPEHGTLPITLTGVDPDWELLTLEPVPGSGPAHGTLTGSSPDYFYTPDTTFPPTNTASGFDTFQYRAFDPSGDASAPALVTIQVTPVDDAPVAHSGEIETSEDTAIALIVSASDEENEPLTYEVEQFPQHGTLTGAGPTFVYAPGANCFGDDTFTFIAIDSADPSALPSALATVTIHVSSRNDPPVAHAQGVITTEDTPVLITLSASDVDHDQLTFLVPRPAENGETFAPQHGALTPTEDPKVWLYTPAPNSTVPDQFTFQARDPAGEISEAVVSIVVTPINDFPVATPLTLAVDEDQPLALTLSGVDVDDFDLTYDVIEGTGLAIGTLAGSAPSLIYQSRPDLSGPDFFDFIAIDSLLFESAPARVSVTVRPVNDAPVAQELEVETAEDAPIEITFDATDVEGDAVAFLVPTAPSYGLLEPLAPGHYRYTPDANFHGTDTFTYAANDGQADSPPAAVTIRVLPQNDTPVASPPPPLFTREDTPLTLTLTGADIDGDALTILDPSAPAHGTLVRDPDQPSRFIYTPATNYHGSDTFTYAVYDGAMESPPTTVTIEVESVNDAPIVDAGTDANTTLGTAASLSGTVDDVDDAIGQGLTLAWTKVSGPGAVVFSTPEAAAALAQFTATGTYVLRLTASDSEFSVADDVTVIVAPGNRAPVVEAGANQTLAAPGSVALAGNANDDGLPTGDALRFTWRKLSGPSAVSLTSPQQAATGATFADPGTYVLELTASDGQFAAADTLIVTVARPNVAPIVSAGPDASIAFAESAMLAGQITDDGLPQGAGLNVLWTKVSGPGTVAFTDAGSAATQATFSAPGVHVLQLEASDSEFTRSSIVSITVQPPTNQPPHVEAGPAQTLSHYSSTFLHGSVTDDGLPGTSVTTAWSKVSGPGAVTFDNSTGLDAGVRFAQPGTYVLRLTGSDSALSASDDVTIVVAGENEPPTVDAGDDLLIDTSESAYLAGWVIDDGLPSATLSVNWSMVSGPGAVVFTDPHAASTTATFTVPGTYVLRLSASDLALTATDEMIATVAVSANCTPAPPGLAALWRADNNTQDALGGHNGTAQGALSFAPGEVGSAFVFNGTNTGVIAPAGTLFDFSAHAGATIECWIKPASYNIGPLVECVTGNGCEFWMVGNGQLAIQWSEPTGAQHLVSSAAATITLNTWQHVATTFNRDSGEVSLYRNGVLVAQKTFGAFIPRSGANVTIGYRPGSFFHQGSIDEVSIYTRALGATEIASLYAAGSNGKCGGELAGDVTLDAGPDRTVALLQEVALAGEFSDWRPQPRQALATSWSLVSGPGNVQFADVANPETTASFSTPGAYVLRLTAQGSALAVSDDVSITVSDAAYVHEIRFHSGNGALSDPLNRYFSGGLWKPANLTGADVYALIPGTSYIVGDFVQFGSSHVRVLFDLPAGFAQPNLSFQYYADNAARFHLNGTVIAEQPFDSDVARYVGTPATGSDAAASHFQAGVNTLDIETYNTFGPLAVDYEALLRYAAPPGGNLPPVINAGADRELGAPGQIVLAATVSDDGKPFPEFFSFEWIHSHGPAAVAFSDRRSLQPTVTFSAPGEYVLLFKANDGELSATDSLTVTVRAGAAGNLPPLVDAGPPRSGILLQAIHLAGTISDDHTAAADLHIQWRKVSGPGAVAFAAVGSAETDAAFSAPGSYVLALGADDSQFAVTDTTTVEVASQPVSNAPPTANAGSDRSVALQAGYVQLQGSTTDDGLPAGLSPTVRWEFVSAPHAAVISAPQTLTPSVFFQAAGDYRLRLTVADGFLSASDEIVIHVAGVSNLPPQNTAPILDAGPDLTVTFGESAPFQPLIEDDGLPSGSLTAQWSVVSGPGSVSFGGSLQNLTATFSQVGDYVLRLSANDGALAAFDEVTVHIVQGAHPSPTITLTTPTTGANVEPGVPALLIATAAQPSGGIVKVEFYVDGSLVGEDASAPYAAPWTPWNVGTHTLVAVVQDTIGVRATSASVPVNAAFGPPVVRFDSPLDGAAFAPGTTIPLSVSASSGAGLARVDFFADGALVGSDASAPFTATWSSSTEGAHEFSATAIATDGQTGSATRTIFVLTQPAAPPIAEITAPTDGGSVTAPTTVLGSVSSPALRDWTLDYQRLGVECGTWVLLAQGTGAVQNDALAVFDPTLLINGHYELRLIARDRFGGVSASSTQVAVEGGMKVGHFTVAFEDLRVPLAGLPLSVVRTYDSREQCAGDFGYGWRLDVESLRLEQSAPAGEGWSIRATVGTLTTPSTYQLVDEGGHLLSVRLPDGELLRFRPKLVVDRPYNRLASLLDGDGDDVGQAWLPFQYTQPLRLIYHALGGTRGATLRSRGYRAFDPWSGGASTMAGDAALYVGDPSDGPMSLATHENSAQDAPLLADATGWELTLQDGRVFIFDSEGRLESMRDSMGNTLSFVRDAGGRILRVSHSSGAQVVFHRDADGFVEHITDPSGRELHYGYDAAGHLRTFHDREADPATEPPTQSFTYRAGSHLLDDLFDGRGVRAARNYYDAEGRLERSVDADGNETRLTHDLTSRIETVRDRAGNVTRHHYDARGNVTRTEQPDGTVVTMAYHVWSDGRMSDLKVSQSVSGLFSDGAGGLTPKTLTTLYSYEDDNAATPPANDGLLRKLVDPLGHASHFSYDSQGHLLTVIDALGHTTTNTYHPGTSLLTTTTDGAGNVTHFTYDARGLLDKETRTVTVVDETGTARLDTLVTDHDYDANGYLVRMVDPAGHATTFENDAHGNQLFERTTRTVNGASIGVVTEHEYDANDHLVRTWDAEHPRAGGHVPTSETVYDENGRVAITRDALGRETAMTYDARGLLTRTDFADGTSGTVLYDSEGRREFARDRRGKTTQTIYDTLGRVSSTVFLGSGSDAPVALSATTYDAAGRVYQSTDANGHTTTNIYDDAGRRVTMIDPLDHTSTSQYDAASNQRFFTDALGRTTEHLYDVLNRRVKTVHPPSTLDVNGDGAISADEESVVTTTSTGYDELSRRVSETDANGRTTRFIFDTLGRLTAVVQPSAPPTITRYTYDELRNQLTQTDANNHTTNYGYDNLGRRTTRTLPGGQSESLGYNAIGNLAQRTDFNGTVTGYIYDALNRVLSRTSSHPNAAASNVSFTYTASGQRATMTDASGVTTYSYDARDRLESKATPQGTLSYTYDAAGNVASISSSNANGTAVAYRYDELNRLAEVEEGAGEITHYGYNEVGNLAHVSTANGVTHAYGYNALNRLTQLSIQNATASLAHFAYTQLPTGHRSSAVEEFAGTLANPQPTTRHPQYRYDALYRLTSETIITNTGPGGGLSYGLDPVGNRLARNSTVAGLTSQTSTYDTNDRLSSDGYDANGNTTTGHIALNAQGAETAPQTVTDTYDAENRLISRSGSLNSLNILYDGDGNKVRETINGQTFTYLVDNLNPTSYAQVLEELQNGTVIRLYTYGHDLLVQDQRDGVGNWNATWYGYDGHGSVRLLTDGAGQVTDRYDYDAFGTLLHAEGATFNRYRYCGEPFDDALGLYYLRARYVNVANGRFWSADSYEGRGADPQSLHKYLYVGAEPVGHLDPSGNLALVDVGVSTFIRASIAAGVFGVGTSAYTYARTGSVGIAIATGAQAALTAFITVLSPIGAVSLGLAGVASIGYSAAHGEISARQIGEIGAFTAVAIALAVVFRTPMFLQIERGIAGELATADASLNVAFQQARSPHSQALTQLIDDIPRQDWSAPPGKSSFWTTPEGKLRAEADAGMNGGVTLERTSGGQWLESNGLFKELPQAEQFALMRYASLFFARQARGPVKAFVGGGNPSGTFEHVEAPTLENNPNVTSLEIIK